MAGLMVVEDLRREAATWVQVQGLVERLQGRAAACESDPQADTTGA